MPNQQQAKHFDIYAARGAWVVMVLRRDAATRSDGNDYISVIGQ